MVKDCGCVTVSKVKHDLARIVRCLERVENILEPRRNSRGKGKARFIHEWYSRINNNIIIIFRNENFTRVFYTFFFFFFFPPLLRFIARNTRYEETMCKKNKVFFKDGIQFVSQVLWKWIFHLLLCRPGFFINAPGKFSRVRKISSGGQKRKKKYTSASFANFLIK